jgi:hypothetical protein
MLDWCRPGKVNGAFYSIWQYHHMSISQYVSGTIRNKVKESGITGARQVGRIEIYLINLISNHTNHTISMNEYSLQFRKETQTTFPPQNELQMNPQHGFICTSCLLSQFEVLQYFQEYALDLKSKQQSLIYPY